MTTLFIDVETCTYNKGHPFDPRNRLISYAYTEVSEQSNSGFVYFNDPDFKSKLRVLLESASVLVGFNIKFDLHWINVWTGYIPGNKVRIWDCQLAEFILSGQTLPYDSLNEALERYGLPIKQDAVAEYWAAGIDTADIPVNILEEYNKWDVYVTRLLFENQQKCLSEKQKRLVYLEGEDLKALAAAERAGIKFDVENAKCKLAEYKATVASAEEGLNVHLPAGIPDGCWNWDSGDHLSCFLYGGTLEFKYVSEILAYKSGSRIGQSYNRYNTREVQFPQRFKPLEGSELKKTKEDPSATTRYYSTDAPTLLQLKTRRKEDREILTLLSQRSNAIKVAEMIEGIFNKMAEKNWTDNLIHPQYNQNVVITGRLSSSQPNMQNQPPEVDELLISRYVD